MQQGYLANHRSSLESPSRSLTGSWTNVWMTSMREQELIFRISFRFTYILFIHDVILSIALLGELLARAYTPTLSYIAYYVNYEGDFHPKLQIKFWKFYFFLILSQNFFTFQNKFCILNKDKIINNYTSITLNIEWKLKAKWNSN